MLRVTEMGGCIHDHNIMAFVFSSGRCVNKYIRCYAPWSHLCSFRAKKNVAESHKFTIVSAIIATLASWHSFAVNWNYTNNYVCICKLYFDQYKNKITCD